MAINMLEQNILIDVSSVFENGEKLRDFYSDKEVVVINGKVNFTSIYSVVLLEKIE